MGLPGFGHAAACAAAWAPRGRPVRWVGFPRLRRAAVRAASWALRALSGMSEVVPRLRQWRPTSAP
eukprot:6546979-Pyramimonas_sp.AAC.1